MARMIGLFFCLFILSLAIFGNGFERRHVVSKEDPQIESWVEKLDEPQIASHHSINSSPVRNKSFSNLDGKVMVSGRAANRALLVTQRGGTYSGVKATLNVYALPSVTTSQTSSIQIWIGNEKSGEVVQAGWHVDPKRYGDHETHFFICWTVDNYKTKACCNFDCKGFKQNDTSHYVPGNIIRPVSEYNGNQYEITLKIQQNHNTGDWCMYHGRNGDELAGYWQKDLFTLLVDNASRIVIGGKAGYNKGDLSPPMGSGHFSREGEGKAAYVKHIQFADQNGLWYTPKDDAFFLSMDQRDCYDIAGRYPTNTIYLGGPGGCKS